MEVKVNFELVLLLLAAYEIHRLKRKQLHLEKLVNVSVSWS